MVPDSNSAADVAQLPQATPGPAASLPAFREKFGWLEKKWDDNRTFDKRWFVLRPDALYYYGQPEDVSAGKEAKVVHEATRGSGHTGKEAKGKLPLPQASLVPREEGKAPKPKLKMRWRDASHDRMLTLQAESVEEITEWMTCLDVAISLVTSVGGGAAGAVC